MFVFGERNFILVGSKVATEQAMLLEALREGAAAFPPTQPVVVRALPTFRRAVAGEEWPIFTDDRNDVEFRSFRMSY